MLLDFTTWMNNYGEIQSKLLIFIDAGINSAAFFSTLYVRRIRICLYVISEYKVNEEKYE
jgi:hypothetical protein